MSTLLVTFEIKWETDDKAYNRIYAAVQEAIKEGLNPADWWNETTSFYVVKSDKTASAFAAHIWNTAKMRMSKDKLLVLDANVKAGRAIGNIEDPTLYSLLPFVKNID